MNNAISKILIAIILFFTFPAESFSLNLSSNVIDNSVFSDCRAKTTKKQKEKNGKSKKECLLKI